MKKLWAVLMLMAVMAWTPSLAAAAPAVNVSQFPPATMLVGESFEVKAAPATEQKSLLTLTMVDLETGSNVDLEGWIPGSAGQQVSGKADANWSGKAGKAGRYRVYVTAVPLDQPGMIVSSAPSELVVNAAPAPHADRLMAVAVGEPLVVALAIGWVLVRRRRANPGT